MIDKEYLQQYFIEDKYKNDCYYIKGVIYFSRKEYEKAFDSLYKALKYFKNNDNETFENCQGGLIDSGINIHKKFIIDKKFPKAKESFNKVTEIITDDKMLNKYKLGCLLNNLNLDRWEEAYELIESLNIEYLDEEKKKILNKLKVIIISNIISEYLKNNNFDNSEKYIKKLYDLAPSVAFNLEIKLIKKKLSEQFENHEYERIISFIDEKLRNLDKIKYAEFYSYLEQFKQDVQKANMQKIYSEGKIDDYLNQIAKNGENQSQEKQEIYNLASEIFNNEAEKDIENGNLEEAEEKIKKGIEKQQDNLNLLNTRAALNYEKNDLNGALEDINNILEKDPENKKVKNNKLNIIEKKYKKDEGKLNQEEKEYIKQNCYKNEDINMKSKSIDIMLQISDKENINLQIMI